MIADLACGLGDLIYPLAAYFSNSKVILNDIDDSVNDFHSFKNIDSIIFNYNFECSLERGLLRQSISTKPNLILLNPPYSCRGGKYYLATFPDGYEVKCSRSLMYVIESLSFLNTDGIIFAILPAGIENSLRDRHALDLLKTLCSANPIAKYNNRAFPDARVETTLWEFKAIRENETISSEIESLPEFNDISGIKVVRGTMQMHTTKFILKRSKGHIPFIHTDNLKRKNRRYINKNHAKKIRMGPCILLPRVGRITPSDIIICTDKEFAISDCIIAIESTDIENLYQRILNNTAILADYYGGSCAKYITLNLMRKFIDEIHRIP
ncbi:hypothetical protein [Deinococcus sp. ME38]|uniref:hypothetical protein n=1 Tax=Deinococcus sp. ME38 TaxID=3400344 RepID=UPI003B5C39B9